MLNLTLLAHHVAGHSICRSRCHCTPLITAWGLRTRSGALIHLNSYYAKVIEFTIAMTPKLNTDDVKLSFGDKFLSQADLQVYFPGIISLWDPYHFCS
jgi:hypothetical protein